MAMEIAGITIPVVAQWIGAGVLLMIFLLVADNIVNKGKRMNMMVNDATKWNQKEGKLFLLGSFLFIGALDYYVEQSGNIVVKYLYQSDWASYEDAQKAAHWLLVILALVIIGAYTAGVGIDALKSRAQQPTMITMLSLALIAIIIGYMLGPWATELLNEVFPPNDQLAIIAPQLIARIP